MAANGVSINVNDHGKALDKEKKRVECNYCSKIVSGVTRLKCHLGGIRGDVVPCNNVPPEVKEAIKKDILDKKKGHLTNEVGELTHPDLPWKRNLNNGDVLSQQGTSQPSGSAASKRVKTEHGSETNGLGSVSQPNGPRSASRPTGPGSVSQPTGPGSVSQPTGPGSVSQPTGPKDLSPQNFQKCVGRFFFETGTDFSCCRAPSFRSMMNAAHPGEPQTGYEITTPHDLEGWILQDALEEMQNYVVEIKNSWPVTGCSILLDGWTDGNGRELVNILVECPKGAVYLRSCDISAHVGDVDPLELIFEEILEEVGVHNVVQIVAYCISTRMEMIGKQLMEKHRTLFWTVSASHCFELMLERFGRMDAIKEVLEKAKTITKFVHNCEAVLNLLEVHNCGRRGLVQPSRFRFAMPFLTLENIVSMKEKLVKIFASVEWTDPIWASSQVEGKRVANLIKDRSFWTGATMVLKAATPLMRVLELINEGGTDKHRLGYIYETMDQVKETVKEEFNDKKSQYLPFWEDIDDIWNTYLHSHLHAAGYFLNPEFFYSEDFYSDPEVTTGLLSCIVRMAESQPVQSLISLQVEKYREMKGGFGQGCSPHNRSNVPPATWWSTYANEYPELQKLAIRILSQTCDGGSRYNLKRDVAEKLLTNKSRNPVVQKRLFDLAFVHYNLHLQNFELGKINGTVLDDEIDPMDDWVVERQAQVPESRNGQPSQPTRRGGAHTVGPSNSRPKAELRTF